MSYPNPETMQLIILILVAVALLANTALIVVILVSVGKLGKKMNDEIADFRSSVMPLVYDTRELVTSLTPKIEATADDLSAIVHGLRSQTQAIEAVGADLVSRLRRQTERVDGMLSGFFGTTDRTGSSVAGRVGKPIRQIAGLVASARAVVETLRGPSRKTHHAREQDNQDTFV